MMSDEEILNAVLREDLVAFIQKSFSTVAPGDSYIHNWHIEAIAHELIQCHTGQNTRLMITQPPRSLKSVCTSVAFVAWAIGHDPSLRFICVSYSQELALELARQFRLVIGSDWYRNLFPAMRLKKDASAECITTQGGGRVATSIGGTLTGRGADIIILDDPLKAEDAQSDTARKNVIEWYSGTLTTRLNDKNTGRIILVMQRLHEEDLAGYLVDTGSDWRHLDLPAIALTHEKIDLGHGRTYQRGEGEPLQAIREPLNVLSQLRQELGSLKFAAQYQQRPIPLEGNLVKRDWFGCFDTLPRTDHPNIIQSWDIATSTTVTADYSVCITAHVIGEKLYVNDVWRGRLSYPDIKRKIVRHAKDQSANTVLIEKDGPGGHLLQELRRDNIHGFPTPIGCKVDGDKAVRMEACSSTIEAGDVLLPNETPWLDTLLREILAFPNSKHDDQVDALSQLLNWKRRRLDEVNFMGKPILISVDAPSSRDRYWNY